MSPISIRNLFCGLLALAGTTLATPIQYRDVRDELKTFHIAPYQTNGAIVIADGTPLQFNGTAPGQGATPEQLGWWPIPIPPATITIPENLLSFVQYNSDRGVVFWAQRTAFEIYLSPVDASLKTYAVILGQPWRYPNALAGDFTITELPQAAEDTKPRYSFGWSGVADQWFVCGGMKGEGEYWGLYYGENLGPEAGCSQHFALEAQYTE